jgi:hypothetical protein
MLEYWSGGQTKIGAKTPGQWQAPARQSIYRLCRAKSLFAAAPVWARTLYPTHNQKISLADSQSHRSPPLPAI